MTQLLRLQIHQLEYNKRVLCVLLQAMHRLEEHGRKIPFQWNNLNRTSLENSFEALVKITLRMDAFAFNQIYE